MHYCVKCVDALLCGSVLMHYCVMNCVKCVDALLCDSVLMQFCVMNFVDAPLCDEVC